jgi:hypothetical protein
MAKIIIEARNNEYLHWTKVCLEETMIVKPDNFWVISPRPPTFFYEKASALALLTVRIALVLRCK